MLHKRWLCLRLDVYLVIFTAAGDYIELWRMNEIWLCRIDTRYERIRARPYGRRYAVGPVEVLECAIGDKVWR